MMCEEQTTCPIIQICVISLPLCGLGLLCVNMNGYHPVYDVRGATSLKPKKHPTRTLLVQHRYTNVLYIDNCHSDDTSIK